MVLLSFIKMTFFLRIFDGFSFLVQMMSSVFVDLKQFLLFFAIFIAALAFSLSILIDKDKLEYEGIGFFGYFAMVFRSSIGDNEMSDYIIKSDMQVFTWIIWLLLMVVGNIILMNFIIAVVNQSYENCMTKLVAQSFKVKLEMIIERESIMGKAELSNTKWFPNFIILRRKVDNDSQTMEWQGFVKEIKHA